MGETTRIGHIKQYLFVIHELTSREINRKYVRSSLGIIWSILHPLLFMIVMSFVFSQYSFNSFEYPAYYVTGYTFWKLFSTATYTSLTVLEDNRFLFQRTKIPREVFVLSRDYTALVDFGYSCIALAIVLAVFRISISWTYLLLLADIFFEMLFTIGISFVLATIFVFYKDIKFLWNNAMILLVHMVAIYIPIERYPKVLHSMTRENPLFIFTNVARECVLYKTINITEIKKMVFWSMLAFVGGLIIFRSKENAIAKKL